MRRLAIRTLERKGRKIRTPRTRQIFASEVDLGGAACAPSLSHHVSHHPRRNDVDALVTPPSPMSAMATGEASREPESCNVSTTRAHYQMVVTFEPESWRLG